MTQWGSTKDTRINNNVFGPEKKFTDFYLFSFYSGTQTYNDKSAVFGEEAAISFTCVKNITR
jgi:hypothetical protein